MSTSNSKPWTPWHLRLHKKLITKKNLIPDGSSLLIAVSGGQDSMALLQLIVDLQRLHKWKLYVWHGDHGWHQKSGDIAKELKSWCEEKNLNFFSHQTTKELTKSEAYARKWRYEQLAKIAKDKFHTCTHILTGHTGSDRAETLLLNLARGCDLAGLSTLPESRNLEKGIYLVRPLLDFSRDDTALICKEMKLPIWIDPSNKNITLSRNKVRKKIFPILEELHPGCSMRMASLAERLCHYKEDQDAIATLLLQAIEHPQGLYRQAFSTLSLTARATLLARWLKQKEAPVLSAAQLEELSYKIGTNKTPGCSHLSQGWKINWKRESIELTQTQ
ncbi:tRNA lysidine(34) synthetase TilS [Prochlorococcus sp. MIT 1307]|uniref:tRNA lysidine(34) synthetase TilS n=1 Tax=Prochlorococcus sp. MIT 1307 TaxID=3096219 RepID=UPI002A74D860|nr:tRNA lysidine(34) synthetase TilS [Prochlorococcus sp. MIT 1307]